MSSNRSTNRSVLRVAAHSLFSLAICLVLFAQHGRGKEPPLELDHLNVVPAPWLTAKLLESHGTFCEAEVPDTLDLAEQARHAVHGLTSFLDHHRHYSCFGHGLFSVQPPVMIHDQGMAQNWGKIAEATILARAMCGSRENLDQQRSSLEGMLSYAVTKNTEPYPVPSVRILMAVDALHQHHPHPQLAHILRQYVGWIQDRMQVDASSQQVYFGTEERRWLREDNDTPMGPLGYSLQMFTGGSVLRGLVRASRVSGTSVDTTRLLLLKNYLSDPRFWVPESHAAMVVPHNHGQFWGHQHSYTQALLGLLYWARQTNDAATLEFVRQSYEYQRTYGIARIGLFGEGCTTGDMTYLAVRLSQWGVGDYWEDIDQYTRNHLSELQIIDTPRLSELVRQHSSPLDTSELGDWAKGLDTNDVIQRCRGLFWSDSSHPTLIPLREATTAHTSQLQWVVCCSGNCTKALHEVWDAIVEDDVSSEIVRVNLLLNRAAMSLDIASHLPHEGKVVLRLKRDATVLVRIPRWVDRQEVVCHVADNVADTSWAGNYLLISNQKQGDTITVTFPMTESVEFHHLSWQKDQFWQESTRPPSFWHERKPVRYKLSFRGNTLTSIEPRDSSLGFALYANRSLSRLRAPARRHRIVRFIPSQP